MSNLANITSGWECELYSFDLECGAAAGRQREHLIVRLYQGANAPRKAAHEFNGMRKLYAMGYPVPQMIALETQDSPFGKPFVVMEKIEGQVMRSLLRGSSEAKRHKLASLFCSLFVQLHKLDWRPFDDVAGYSGVGADWRNCILQEYERLAGAPVTQMECFEVCACVRRLLDVTISLSEGPEKLGMRAEAANLMKKQMDSTRCVYRLLIERTGLEIKEVEKMLGSPPWDMRG